MNESNLNQPPSPPPLPAMPSRQREDRPLGEDPNDCVPLVGPVAVVEAVLRHPRRVVFHLRQSSPGRLIATLLAAALGFIAVYGAIVGSFSGGMQWWATPLKITAGLAVTAAICLPSLYIFTCLCGSSARLPEVAGALGGMLALMTLLLIGFAPVAWLFSQSTESVAMMGFFHVIFWLVSVGFGIRFLNAAFQHFGLRSDTGLKAWMIIYLLVSLQMTSALRPLLGPGDNQPLLPVEKKFFAAHWLDNLDGEHRTSERGPTRNQ
ncbi:MAG: hypothetical protein WCL04_04610 [Verrucomicrobiota bacterium]